MVIKAVVFDLDGTLTTLNVDYRAIRAEVRSFLISVGIPASILSLNERIFEMLKKTEIYMKNNSKSSRLTDEIREKALAIAEKHEFEAAKGTSLLPGTIETLRRLQKMGLKIGLCTVNSERPTNYALKRLKIAEYFDTVVTRNKVKQVKPDSEHLAITVKALGITPSETIFVGDSAIDAACAKELKVISVGLTKGFSTSAELVDSGADYIVPTVTELPQVIKKINQNPNK